MHLKINLFAIAVIFALCRPAIGQTIYVAPDGPADPNGSYDRPFSTIRQAMDAAASYDTIILKPGTYSTVGDYNLDPNGLIVAIESLQPGDFDVVCRTIIDPNSQGPFLHLANGEDPNFVIAGLTVRNGYETSAVSAGGITCAGSSPTIRYCIFQNCRSEGEGGAVSFEDSSESTIQNCIFAANSAWNGGAAFLWQSSVRMVNCTVIGNSANFNGGGLFCDSNSEVTLENCIFWGNQLTEESSGGHQITAHNDSDLTVSYCDIQGGMDDINTGSGTSDLFWLYGNFDADPNFAFFSPQTTASTWDLHLQSEYGRWDGASSGWVLDAITSVCIGAGNPAADYSAETWPNGKRINMGAYGGSSQASMFGNKADFDLNRIVDLSDLAELLAEWLQHGDTIVDLDRNSYVDIADFAIFSPNWLIDYQGTL